MTSRNGIIATELILGQMVKNMKVNGKMQGQGTATLPDGRKYAGEWKDGMRHGKGTMFDSTTGESKSGKWKDDKPYGRQVIVNY